MIKIKKPLEKIECLLARNPRKLYRHKSADAKFIACVDSKYIYISMFHIDELNSSSWNDPSVRDDIVDSGFSIDDLFFNCDSEYYVGIRTLAKIKDGSIKLIDIESNADIFNNPSAISYNIEVTFKNDAKNRNNQI